MIGAKYQLAASRSSRGCLTQLLYGRNVLLLRTFGGLWVENEDGSRRDGVRPRPLALLALLAAAGSKGRSREQILAILWPDSAPDRARAALSQTLYRLNSDLNADVVLATAAELRMDATHLTSDLDQFNRALDDKDWSRAAALYQGPFLDGFFLSEAPEFEHWLDEERSDLTREAAHAIERVARNATESGQPLEAAEQWQRLTRLDPLHGAYAVAYMNALAQLGDRAGAIAHGRTHAELVRKEFETDPDPEVVELLNSLRERGAKLAPARREQTPSRVSAPSPPLKTIDEATVIAADAATSSGLRPRLRLALVALLGVVILVGLPTWRTLLRPSRAPASPVLAVGQVRDLVTPDSVALGGVLSEMLATSIGRLTNLEVIANSRLLELIPRGADTGRAARTSAARRAGATQVLEGELIPLAGGDARLRFEARRLDIQRGIVRAGYQLDGNDRIALFDSIAVLIAADLGMAPPARSLAEASTRSSIAYRLYEEGLRAFSQSEVRAAYRLFSAAVREDSTFAMATYFLMRSEAALGLMDQYATSERALRLASRAVDRDRLLILTHVLTGRSEPTAVPVAESLITRYPNDPEALVRAAEAINNPARAITLLNRAIAFDSAAGAETSAYCRLCEALSLLAGFYYYADSLAAAKETARRWMRFRPKDSAPWLSLAEYQLADGQRAEAEGAQLQAMALGAPRPDEGLGRLVWSLRTDDVSAADDECRTGLARSTGERLGQYRWHCTISLRAQGRFHEALRLVGADPPIDVNDAILAMEVGEPAVAANRFLRLARETHRYQPQSPGWLARNVAWNLTLAGTAFSEAGDTLSVRRLVDSIEATGRRSLLVRDPLLHHFLRGLLLAKSGRHDSATQEFRAALYSPSLGYTRVNYELGKSLIALRRAAEAIPILRAPLRGALDGPGLYLTRTETHEMLARAFDAAGQRDSAAAHYMIVERIWRHADPQLMARYEAVRARLAALGIVPPKS